MNRGLVALASLSLLACNGNVAGNPDAGSDAGACPVSSVTFDLRAPPGAASGYCTGAPSACSNEWLSIVAPNGDALVVDWPCQADCDTCEPVGCPASCMMPSRLTEAGVQRAWDGTYYAGGTCGAQGACTRKTCATAGRYVARMCAWPDTHGMGTGCAPAPTPTCAEVAFDWPPATPGATVTGSLGDVLDAGVGCCAPASSMYGCTWPDGGAGLACHDPALGCASSTTCGEGCDPVVSGRCPTR